MTFSILCKIEKAVENEKLAKHKNEDPLPEGNRSPKAVWNGRDNYLTPKSSSP